MRGQTARNMVKRTSCVALPRFFLANLGSSSVHASTATTAAVRTNGALPVVAVPALLAVERAPPQLFHHRPIQIWRTNRHGYRPNLSSKPFGTMVLGRNSHAVQYSASSISTKCRANNAQLSPIPWLKRAALLFPARAAVRYGENTTMTYSELMVRTFAMCMCVCRRRC